MSFFDSLFKTPQMQNESQDYMKLFKRFFEAQEGSPLLIPMYRGIFAKDSFYSIRGEFVIPISTKMHYDDGKNYYSTLFLQQHGNAFGIGRAIVDVEIFNQQSGRINGRFTNAKEFSEGQYLEIMEKACNYYVSDDSFTEKWCAVYMERYNLWFSGER